MEAKRQRTEEEDGAMNTDEPPIKVLYYTGELPYKNVKLSIIAYKKDDRWTMTLAATLIPVRLFDDLLTRQASNKIKLTNIFYHPCDADLVNDIIQWYYKLSEEEKYRQFGTLEDDYYDIGRTMREKYEYIEEPNGEYIWEECSEDCTYDNVCLKCNFIEYAAMVFYRDERVYNSHEIIEKLSERMEEPFFSQGGQFINGWGRR